MRSPDAVVFCVFAFARERDRVYVVVTILVLSVLAYSLAGGMSRAPAPDWQVALLVPAQVMQLTEPKRRFVVRRPLVARGVISRGRQ